MAQATSAIPHARINALTIGVLCREPQSNGYKDNHCNSSHQQNQGKRALTDELSQHQRACHKIRELPQRFAQRSPLCLVQS
jgi:hypothetical protein